MDTYDQIVIGSGTSALSFLYYSMNSDSFGADSTLMIGGPDLWKAIASTDREHRFGQPKQIVSLPQKGKPGTVNNPTFRSASDIDSELDDLKKAVLKNKSVRALVGTAEFVARRGRELVVTAKIKQEIGAATSEMYCARKRVILATGPGASKRPDTLPEEVVANLDQTDNPFWRDYIIGGTEYLYLGKNPRNGEALTVAVQGSSATSSWAVAKAIALGATKIYWITRSGYRDANPAGRNSDILTNASEKGWLYQAEISRIAVTATGVAPAKVILTLNTVGQTPREVLERPPHSIVDIYKAFYEDRKITGYKDHKTAASARLADLGLRVTKINGEQTVEVDQYVYALGADPTLKGGSADILSPGLIQEMEPVFDTDCRFSDVPEDTVIAFTTKKQDVWLVGAGIFRNLGRTDLDKFGRRYTTIAAMMCEVGSPPEGIAVALAANKALTKYVNLSEINIQTADFKELEEWLGRLYHARRGKPASTKVKRLLADQVVAFRKHTVFGLSAGEVEALGDPNNQFWDHLFDSSSGSPLIDSLEGAV